MKRKYLTHTLLLILGLIFVVSPASASAMGWSWFGGFNKTDPDAIASRMQTMFQTQANLLGINIDQLKNCWAQGKSIRQCAQDQGITQEQLQQKMKDARLAQLKSQMQTLVDKGVITQAQADQRLQWMQSKIQNCNWIYGFKSGWDVRGCKGWLGF